NPVVANEPINSFNAEKWKKNFKYDREKSVHDLIDRKLLTDLTEKKVFELLGAPDSKEGTHWDYEIRPESASFETLFVYFENGKVVKYELKANP
ncbi:MAG: hypothetical protein JST44_25435, partial [Cyanobacteria bacterium SZAS LIN-5]|nr:hypothetical protein [Cyanobacteria bacterium SZAS LIN-5]